MTSHILMRFPADREQVRLACAPVLGVPLFVRNCLTLIAAEYPHLVIAAPPPLHRHINTLWTHYVKTPAATLVLLPLGDDDTLPADQLFAVHSVMAERFVVLHALTAVTDAWVREALGPAVRHGHSLRGGQMVERDALQNQLPTTGQPEPPFLARHYVHVQYSSDSAHLEDILSDQIRHGDIGWFAKHLNKRISIPISRWLARWRISPHLITVFNMAIGIGAGIAAAGDSYGRLLLAGTLFQLASIVDGCDGEVAKFTFRTSRFGQLIDTVGDTTALLCFFIGLSLHATVGLIATLFGGIITFVAIMFVYLARHGNSWSLVEFDRLFVRPRLSGQRGALPWLLHYGKLAIKKDCFSWVFFGLSVIGVLPAALYLAAIATWVAVGGLFWISRLPLPNDTATDAVSSRLHPQTTADSRDQIPQHR